ncbi:Probable ATP-dependent RNA helicase DHX35 [Geodia barretti]|uniref:RNA helicase n=1 Tax=Geodia barretti TaxID=519541 RepID=A0AA35WB16_GEOBA|nr:Probable ATP-dependent RNA helicase DHX35 [Geodia barretti]
MTSSFLQPRGPGEDRETHTFRGGGRSRAAGSVNLERQAEGSEGAGTVLSYNPHINLTLTQQRQRLPIFKYRSQIMYLTEKYRTVVIIGETGSGKTTQIPQYLHEANWTGNGYVVGITQPRRVAATTVSPSLPTYLPLLVCLSVCVCRQVASRVADERGAMLGREVGYSIRFDSCCDPKQTRIKFLTDGMLVREMMKDPLLKDYSVMILDEAHERTLHTDIIVGLLRKIMKKRDDLRLIVSSATLDAELFKNFFETNPTRDSSRDTAVILTVEGRVFSVQPRYVKRPVANYVTSTVETVLALHREERNGDVLAFLTGQEEVDTAVAHLGEHASRSNKGMQLMAVPLYGGLPYGDQLKVFQRAPPNTRKVVVATNIAETSVTLPGIVFVVDCGFVKLRTFSLTTYLESLMVVPVSQSSAVQRAGRAGRVRTGKVFRLYTEDSYEKLEQTTVPEMQRSNLAPVILQLKALGVDNVLRFHFLSPPPADSMLHALELLYALGALDDDCQLTQPLGHNMAEFPLPPMFARMLLTSDTFGCSDEAVTITAMLQVHHVFNQTSRQKASAEAARRKFCVYEGDHMTLLNVYKAFIRFNKDPRWCQQHFLNYKGLCHAVSIREQLIKLLKRFKIPLTSCEGDPEPVQRCIVSGFFPNAARLHYTGSYRTVRGDHTLLIHPSSILHSERSPPWVVFNEVIQTSKQYMRDVTVIKPGWLYELAPHFYEYGTERELAEAKRRRTDAS